MSTGFRPEHTVVNHLVLELLPELFAVAQLEPDSPTPSWAEGGPLVSVTRTHTELSIVCAEASVPDDVQAQRGWRGLRDTDYLLVPAADLESALRAVSEAGHEVRATEANPQRPGAAV